jgi:hypothetical protein
MLQIVSSASRVSSAIPVRDRRSTAAPVVMEESVAHVQNERRIVHVPRRNIVRVVTA